MSVNQIKVDAPAQAVWDVLADPPSYKQWVVGNKAILGYDPSWPVPDTEFRHKVGFGPLTVRDKTVSLEAERPRRLGMNVRVWPIGHGIVTFQLEETGSATLVRMKEVPAGGPLKMFWTVADPLVKLRNAETLRRLKRLAESRHAAQAARG